MRGLIAMHLRPHEDAFRPGAERGERNRAAFERVGGFFHAEPAGGRRRKRGQNFFDVSHADCGWVDWRHAESLVLFSVEQRYRPWRFSSKESLFRGSLRAAEHAHQIAT